MLVAVSIPIFTAQLEKAREATDLANQRAAKAAAVAAYLEDTATGEKVYYYNASTGSVASAKADTNEFKYGKGTTTVGNSGNTQDGYSPSTSYKDKCVKVTISPAKAATESTSASDQQITISWE